MAMRVCFALFLAVVTVLSVIPDPEEVPGGMALTRWLAALLLGDPEMSDKLAHFIAYGALAGAGLLGLVRPFSRLLALPVCLVFYGIAMELAQGVVGQRAPEWADILANVVGIGAGSVAALSLLLLAKRARSAKPQSL